MRMLEEEDPQLHIVWNEALGEIQAQVMGDVQMEILKSQVQERFGVRSVSGKEILYIRKRSLRPSRASDISNRCATTRKSIF